MKANRSKRRLWKDIWTRKRIFPAELVPENPLRKNSIVDVRCRDNRGRQFIVEMQMAWSPEFRKRVLFNAAKAYVRQLGKGHDYGLLEPVYSLSLVNDVMDAGLPGYYHSYRMVHEAYSDRVIEGLHLVFIELLSDPEVGKALSEIRASAFTDAELAGYDKFWDQVGVEVTLYNSGERKGRAEGERQKALEIAWKLKALGQSVAEIASLTGLSSEEVEGL